LPTTPIRVRLIRVLLPTGNIEVLEFVSVVPILF
jgi:hypothetical protein